LTRQEPQFLAPFIRVITNKGLYKTMTALRILVACVLLMLMVNGLTDIPERARGGKLWQRKNKNSLKKLKSACMAGTYNQVIDHFEKDKNEGSTFVQRYNYDTSNHVENGPVFLYISGEGTLSGCANGYVAQLAEQYNAATVALEHRFYGESIPNGNLYTDNYKYLTVDQALADLDAFSTYFLQEMNMTSSKIFVFGGSYAGGLSSFYRHAYPLSSAGSLSSSGVVNQIVDFYQFDEAVSAACGNACANQIKRTRDAFVNTMSTEEDFQSLLTGFKCEADMAQTDFQYMIADSWSMAVQYGAKTDLCSTMLSVGEDSPDSAFVKTFTEFSNEYWGSDFCSGGFYNTKQLADPLRWETNSRSWRWQTCLQEAWFNTAPQRGSLRDETVNLDYHLKQCSDMFGIDMYPAAKHLVHEYGGMYPTSERVFYSDFSDDPWKMASVQFPVGVDQPYYYAISDDLGHCADLHQPSDSDPQSLKDERLEFETYLTKWLA